MHTNKINLLTWFDARKVEYSPKHFVRTRTPLTDESEVWIEEKLSGRYSFYNDLEDDEFFHQETYPAFEDPKEAILYELTWSK